MNRRLAVGALAAATALAVAGGSTSAVAAGTTPPWEPDPGAVGTITFYDAQGNVITHGSTTSGPFAAYAVGSVVPQTGNSKAVMRAANPQPGTPTAEWYADDLGSFTSYPIASGSAPADVVALSQNYPVATGSTSDESLSSYESSAAQQTATGYQNVVQIRLVTANANGQQSTSYDDADLLIDPSAGTWQEEYPTQTVVTQDDSSLSISAPRAAAKYGSTGTFSTKATDTTSGAAISGQAVSLLERTSPHAAFRTVAKANTTSAGVATAHVRLTANGQFEWTFASSPTHKGATSSIATVHVAQTLSISATPTHIKHGARTTIYGTATPSGNGQKVSVQELVGHKWKTVGTVKIRKQKLPNHHTEIAYAVAVKLAKKGTYSFRAVKGATSTLLGATSRTVKVAAK